MPADNGAYWKAKIQRNVERDRAVTRALRQSNWRVMRIWEHELRDEKLVEKRLSRFLRADRVIQSRRGGKQ